MGAGLQDVPPPGARTARPGRPAMSAHGSLPPGGRRATPAKPAGAGGARHGGAAGDGAAAGAAVWSARQGSAGDGPTAAWATPVGATSHPEFKPGAAVGGDWAAGAEEQAPANAKARGPVLWGLVLLIGAALAAVAFWLARSVSTERDLAALARLASLPPSPAVVAPATPPASSPVAQTAVQPAAPPAASPDAGPATAGAPSAAPPAPGPIAADGRDTNPESPVPPMDPQAARPGQPPEAAAPAFAARPPASGARSSAQTTRKQQSQSARAAAAPSQLNRDRRLEARMTPRERESLYSQVFKRCPPPGAYGALQCRKHICNGAEGLGPACRHINRLKL